MIPQVYAVLTAESGARVLWCIGKQNKASYFCKNLAQLEAYREMLPC